MQNIQVFPTAQDCVHQVAKDFLALSLENRPVHISLSGGSTPKLLFKTLSLEPFKSQIQWQNLHFWWGDERMVAPNDPESNFGVVNDLLFSTINIPQENIHRIRGENDLNTERDRFEKEMIELVPELRFDYVLLGMGDDGHTASLFPHQTDYKDERLACTAQHPTSGQWRISKTAKLLRMAKRLVFLVTGENKAMLIGKILNPQTDPTEIKDYPSAQIKPEQTDWIIDSKAASLL